MARSEVAVAFFPNIVALTRLPQVVVKALDPSKTESTTSDIDSVSLARKLALGLQKSSSYIEGPTGTDTIEYTFKVRPTG